MDKLVDAFSGQGVVGLMLLGIFGAGYLFLTMIERIFNNRTDLIKHILEIHSTERNSWLEAIKQFLNRENQK